MILHCATWFDEVPGEPDIRRSKYFSSRKDRGANRAITFAKHVLVRPMTRAVEVHAVTFPPNSQALTCDLLSLPLDRVVLFRRCVWSAPSEVSA